MFSVSVYFSGNIGFLVFYMLLGNLIDIASSIPYNAGHSGGIFGEYSVHVCCCVLYSRFGLCARPIGIETTSVLNSDVHNQPFFTVQGKNVVNSVL